MANDACGLVKNEYVGDGTTKLFSFTFEYDKQDEVYVSLRDPTTTYFVPLDRSAFTFVNPTTVELNQAPEPEYTRTGKPRTNVRIFRSTDINSMVASFYPGSAIRAQDLNANFEQLRLALLEGRCTIPQPILDYLEDNYWDKNSETITSLDEWVSDDLHVATTGAIAQQTTTPADLAEKWDKNTESVYSDDSWNSTDTKVASTAAINQFVVNAVDGKDIGVSKLIAGERIKLDPASGIGVVTITGERSKEDVANVKVSDTAPTDNVEGDLWWDTNDGRLYVWYIDADSAQWVDASPDSLASSFWDRNGTTLSPSNAGDNLDGIGSATFAGSVTSNTNGFDITLGQPSNGVVAYSKNTTASNILFYGLSDIGGTAQPKVKLFADGSATFAGYIRSISTPGTGTYVQADDNEGFTVTNANITKARIAMDGSATFAARVTAGDFLTTGDGAFRTYSNNAGVRFGVYNNAGNVSTATINNDGSANFASTVQVGGNPFPGTATGFAAYIDGSIALSSASSTGTILFGYTTGSSTSTTLIKADGSATFTGTVTATVVPPSDARFKENITPAKPQLADVVALGGILKNYDWNDDAPVNDEIRAVRQLGLIAQEAEEVCPGIVKDIGSEEDGYKGISYDALIMKMLGAIAELKAEIEELKSA